MGEPVISACLGERDKKREKREAAVAGREIFRKSTCPAKDRVWQFRRVRGRMGGWEWLTLEGVWGEGQEGRRGREGKEDRQWLSVFVSGGKLRRAKVSPLFIETVRFPRAEAFCLLPSYCFLCLYFLPSLSSREFGECESRFCVIVVYPSYTYVMGRN